MDIKLNDVFTPVMAIDRGFTLVDTIGENSSMVYARLAGEDVQYIVTRLMLVTTITNQRHTAEYSAV